MAPSMLSDGFHKKMATGDKVKGKKRHILVDTNKAS
jgi:hypothetical protein